MNTTETPVSMDTTDPHDPEWWKDIPKQFKFVTRSVTYSHYLHKTKPEPGVAHWRSTGKKACTKDVVIREKNWHDAIVERPIDYSECIGKLCFFSFEIMDKVTSVGPCMLIEYNPDMDCAFKAENGDWWENCTPVTKEQVLKYLYE